MRPSRSYLLLLLAALSAPGCMASGIYRTAHTLPKGEGDFSMSFSAVRISTAGTTVTDEDGTKHTGKGETVTIPNLIPELSYHIGVADNLELGGRVALAAGLIELDCKYRFVGAPGEPLHLAVQPALGYRSLFIIEGLNATLPLILTYDLSDMVSLNIAPFVSYLDLSTTDDDFGADLNGTFLTTGASVGISLQGETFHIMPAVEFSRTATNFDAGDAEADISQDFVIFSITFGWGSGKEMKKLKEMDQKLDRIEQKLDARG